MLKNAKDVNVVSSRFVDAVASGPNFLTLASDNNYREINSITAEQLNTDLSIVSNCAGISLITSASAVIVSSSSSQVDFVEIGTNHKTSYTSGASPCARNLQGQQVAGNIYSEIALATRNTDGGVLKIEADGTLSTLSPAELSGDRATCIIVKEATGANPTNWLVGTDNNEIHEMDSSGTVVNTITLPTTPNDGTAPTHQVTGLSHYPPNLAVTTQMGVLFIYEYESGNLIFKQMISDTNGSTTTGNLLCKAASGLTIMGDSRQPLNQGQGTTAIYFASPTPIFYPTFYNETNSATTSVGINPETSVAFTCFNSTSFLSFRMIEMDPVQMTSEDVSAKVSNSDIAGRVIRIRDDGIGYACIELDENIPDSVTPKPCTDGHNYIDIFFKTNGTEYDVREFTG